jgi:lipoate-protein ligase A
MTPWRLIQDGPASGPWNMGIDEALLRDAHESGHASLRLYRWQGPWLSLGYAQRRIPPAIHEACRSAGVGIVRRTTGGRAVLHGCDLTYSISAPESCLADGLRGSLAQIAEALLAGVRAVGIHDATRAPVASASEAGRDFDCFAESAGDEICVDGKKLVGSAQRRRGGAVLQHGSIRMRADAPDAVEASGLSVGPSTSLAQLGLDDAEAALRAALVEAFASALDADFSAWEADGEALAQARQRCALHDEDPASAPRVRNGSPTAPQRRIAPR